MPSTPPTQEASLHRQLRLRDLVLTQVLCVVGSSWVGIAAGLGRAQALTWIAAMILFYLPMAVSVIYLNREMPLEGGLYVWARTAFGDLGGFMTAWNLWFYGIAVTATILYAIPTELSYLIGPSAAWLPENHLASFAIVACSRPGDHRRCRPRPRTRQMDPQHRRHLHPHRLLRAHRASALGHRAPPAHPLRATAPRNFRSPT